MAQEKINDAEKGMMLKERVWNYIRLHPEGTNIQEVEKEFGEPRMRLGYIIQKLHEEGMIHKTDNTCIPYLSANNE